MVCAASGKAGVCGVGARRGAWKSVEAALPTSSWMSKTRRRRSARSGNRSSYSDGKGVCPSSSRRQNSS